MRRARLIAVVAMLASGAIGVVSATQPWLVVTLAGAVEQVLDVPGGTALPVLSPLSLAVLALGGALSIAGRVLRYVFGALAVVLAVLLTLLTWPIVVAPDASHVAAAVTEVTGITGTEAVAGLVIGIATTAWPAIAAACWVLLLAAGAFVLATAHRWPGGATRYRTADAPAAASRPHDAIDDWDDLSRGEDPTTRPLD